jgi:hypothetical protein
MINNIYTDYSLVYPLTNDEEEIIDKVWKFLDIFSYPTPYLTDYREYLIGKINQKYNCDDFYLYESIANKLFWNLRMVVVEIFKSKGSENCQQIRYHGSEDLEDKLRGIKIRLGNYYRSYINKLIIVDRENQIIYYKKMEGSPDIFTKDKLNVFTLFVLLNRKLYEKIMINPKKIKKIQIPYFYYQQDYGFPNLNCCSYSIDDKKSKIKRIKKMYYNDSQKYWFRLII